MTGIRHLACLWTVVITLAGFGFCGDVSFVERLEGESAVVRCDMNPRRQPPFGLYLRRSWLRPVDVLFKYTKSDATVNESFRGRVSVSGDPSDFSVNVTISQLGPADTDRYTCEFMVERIGAEDEKIPGNTEVFLQVSPRDRCGCSSYPTLLYALSGAVGVLFLLLLLVGCVAAWKGKTRQGAKSRSQAPIYEEMIGVQSPSRKLPAHRLEEVESTEYKNCSLKRASPGNHYESPSGALFPRRDF
uniref:Ig-like domain-containing protein n=1 Tax=Poecilia mexicana TaxID=48701 RepID=A0A3B3YKP0_9TELE